MHKMCIFRILLMVTFSLCRSPSGSFESHDSTGRGGLHGWRFADVRGTTTRWKRWRGCYNFRLTCRQNIWDTDCTWEHDRSHIFAHIHIWSRYVCQGHHRGAHFHKCFGSVNTLYLPHLTFLVEFTTFKVVEHCSWLGIGVFVFKLQFTQSRWSVFAPNLFKPAWNWTCGTAENWINLLSICWALLFLLAVTTTQPPDWVIWEWIWIVGKFGCFHFYIYRQFHNNLPTWPSTIDFLN